VNLEDLIREEENETTQERTRILVVLKDNTPSELKEYYFVEATLLENNYDVFITSSGFTAIQEMRAAYPLVIAQIDISGIRGLELLQTALSIDDESQVLIVTDPSHLPETMETLRLGAYDYLLKPVTDVSELMNKVENAWSTRQLKLENKKLLLDLQVSNENLTRTNRQLEKAKTEIEAWNAELEERVKLRTIELEKANEELRTLDKLKSDFMTNVGHESRTPLTSIKGFTELLLMYPSTDPDQVAEFAGMILQDTNKLIRLVNGMLELSELDSNSDNVNWESGDVYFPDIIETSLEIIRELPESENISFQMKIDENIPIIQANGDKLRTAFGNLLDNAVKFNKEGGRVLVTLRRIKIKGEVWIRCEVRDTGDGISEEHWEVIFDRFRQIGDILTDKPQGMGLGLPITKEIIERHGGRVRVNSTLTKGSVFYFDLPASRKKTTQINE